MTSSKQLMKGALPTVIEAVGNTPIVHLHKVANSVAPSKLYAKLEYTNPGGSVKDRPAIEMLDAFEKEGRLKPGGTIVEATSGNTGMGLAMAAAVRGYKSIFVMPDKMSSEKMDALRAFGAEVVVCPTAVEPEDPRSYYSVSKRLSIETPNAILVNQYHNPSNPLAHYKSTGPEIWEQTEGEIDVFVAAMGTGGTLSGTAKYLKEKKPSLKVIGVDPLGSVYYDYFKTGHMPDASSYLVEGFGEDFLPSTMDFSVVDDVIRVSDKDCFLWTQKVVQEEGLFIGGSAGGIIYGAIKYAERDKKNEHILCIMPDSASRYVSKIFNKDWMTEHGFLSDSPKGALGDMLGATERPVLTLESKASLDDAMKLFKESGLSVLPVLEAGVLKGVLSKEAAMEALLTEGISPNSQISPYLSGAYALLRKDDKIDLLPQIFSQGRVVIVEENKTLKGLISSSDFLGWMAQK